MELRGINHLALVAKDMDATVRFYTQVLNMRLVRAGRNDDDPDSRHYFFDMGGGNLLAFFDFPGLEGKGVLGIGSMHHLSFTVGSLEELMEARERLISQGVHVSGLVDHDFIKSIYFRDPNGILLEISAYTRPLSQADLLADPEPVPAVLGLMEQAGRKPS